MIPLFLELQAINRAGYSADTLIHAVMQFPVLHLYPQGFYVCGAERF